MTIKEFRNGYEKEVAYQKRMLRNLGYWFQLATVVSGVGLVLVYFFRATTLWLSIVGGALFVAGALSMLLVGYAGWKGQQNIRALIDDYVRKMTVIKQTVGAQVRKK